MNRRMYLTNSEVRARNISQALPSVDDLTIFIANIEAIPIDPLFAPVWMMAGDDRSQPLHLEADSISKEGL